MVAFLGIPDAVRDLTLGIRVVICDELPFAKSSLVAEAGPDVASVVKVHLAARSLVSVFVLLYLLY